MVGSRVPAGPQPFTPPLVPLPELPKFGPLQEPSQDQRLIPTKKSVPMVSGFLFDVEGTLVDSVPQNLRGLQDALEKFGYRVPYQTLQLYLGLDGDQTLQLAIPEANENERKQILKEQARFMNAITFPA
jgi:hypothetical protein